MKLIFALVLACAFGITASAQVKPSTNTLTSECLYVAPNQAQDFLSRSPASPFAIEIKKVAGRAQCIWITSDNLQPLTAALAAAKENEIVSVVLYNIQGRDLGQYSAGGASSKAAYLRLVSNIARIIGNQHVLLVVEPDAFGQSFALDETKRNERFAVMKEAITILKSLPRCEVFVEVSQWLSESQTPEALVIGLKACGIDKADGFSLNASGFDALDKVIALGERWSKLWGGKRFVIDTSRNGNGAWKSSDKELWCNPPGRALGLPPTLVTGNPLIRAFLWIKRPGESDGTCRGGPSAGVFWPEYAAELARNAHW